MKISAGHRMYIGMSNFACVYLNTSWKLQVHLNTCIQGALPGVPTCIP